ncbi:MAG: DUF3786 domain-containing protein [Treponema sp.]|jgi:hypothetical protein|nr:DUF3786 domain-containing protein [Treponema sp.]
MPNVRPLNWFLEIYRSLDPIEIASRCNLPFDGDAFSLRIMGTEYRVPFPDYSLIDLNGAENQKAFEKILFIRYLCEGRYAVSTGKQLSYREIPWGDLYFPNFEAHSIKRLASKYGGNLEDFRKRMENPGLRALKLDKGDAGYRFEFMSGLYMSFLLWASDDEFPASAQILFDDNFPYAFTAEDIAVVGDVAISRLG